MKITNPGSVDLRFDDTDKGGIKLIIKAGAEVTVRDEDIEKSKSLSDALIAGTITNTGTEEPLTGTAAEDTSGGATVASHSHTNKAELDLIASGDKAVWDSKTDDTAADAAQADATQALADAATADGKAVAAQSTADSKTDDTAADAAQSTADTALANAATADGKAVAAQSTADSKTDDTAADAAQSTADTALANAATADGKAVAAQSTADSKTDDTAADAAQSTANDALPKAGGTMSGAIAMGTSKITGLGAPSADTDASTKKYVDDNAGGSPTIQTITGGSGTWDGSDMVLIKDDNDGFQFALTLPAAQEVDGKKVIVVHQDLQNFGGSGGLRLQTIGESGNPIGKIGNQHNLNFPKNKVYTCVFLNNVWYVDYPGTTGGTPTDTPYDS